MHVLALLAACGPATLSLGGDAARDDTADTGPAPDDTDTGDSATPSEAVADVAVSVHPEVETILVVEWTQLRDADATWLSWTLDGDTYTSPERATPAGPGREVVLGVPAQTTLPLTLHVRIDGAEATVDLGTPSTGALPDELVAPALVLWDEARALDAPWLLASVDVGAYDFYGPCYVVLFDREARVVWYRKVADRRLTLFPRVARAGTHIAWEATTYYVADPAVPSSITRATLSLSQETETDVEGMGFTWDEMDDGSILYDYAEDGYQYHLTRMDPDGTLERIWSCWPWMQEYSDAYWSCAPNTVHWNPDTGTVVWSMFVTGTVVEIDLATGERVWQFGQLPGGWSADPTGIQLDYQHFPNWTPDGTLILSTHDPGRPHTQVVREFEVDEAARTFRQVWTYTPEERLYADYAGEALRLPNGNTLVDFGTDGALQEVTPEGDVVWEIDWQDKLVGHSTFVEDLYALDEGW